MAQNFTIKKAAAVSKLQFQCTEILDLINQAQALKTEMIDDGFAAGAANAITDADLQNNGFPALQASDLVAAFTAITSLDAALAATARTGYKALSQLRP